MTWWRWCITCLTLTGCLVIVLVTTKLTAEEKVGDWPQFRGPGSRGVSPATGLPVTWDEQKNVLWKTELPGPGTSSPIVVGDRIFLTCYTGYGLSRRHPGDMNQLYRHVVCVQRDDGRILWNVAVKADLPETPFERDHVAAHGYASSTPVADAERVYVFFGKSGVYAFDHAGKQLWHARVGNRIHDQGSGSSLILHQDLLIVNASVESEALVALNRRTGQEVWRAEGVRESWTTPVLVAIPGGAVELVVAGGGRMLGFDPGNGRLLWSCRAGEGDAVATPVAHHGVIYALLDRGGSVLALRAGGRGEVRPGHEVWSKRLGKPAGSPVYHEGYLYFAHASHGIAYCLNAASGEVVYQERLTPAPGDIFASPILADGKLYYVSRERGTYVLAAGPKFRQLAHNTLGDRSPFNASPAVSGHRLLLRSDRALYCLAVR
ncbi:MAG: PQQ-binding-like beta-propeller repeat protein [Gemmatales bacterium]|nr:PQQ-binding-like beta-propeller repeat protein [Gemmatales bacterium]MDW8223719.1 PQQ-binding-like beta-propeller repeat protein [Gemmatales bacterium]